MEAFDLGAAGLRADEHDAAGQLEALAVRLEGALPSATTVRRRGRRLLARGGAVEAIEVRLGESEYRLSAAGATLEATRGRSVRGIRIRTEQLPLDAWLGALTEDLRALAAQSDEARTSLERLLGG